MLFCPEAIKTMHIYILGRLIFYHNEGHDSLYSIHEYKTRVCLL